MLPLQPWLNAMNIESRLSEWPHRSTRSRRSGIRRALGQKLIAIGVALAGTDASARPVGAAR